MITDTHYNSPPLNDSADVDVSRNRFCLRLYETVTSTVGPGISRQYESVHGLNMRNWTPAAVLAEILRQQHCDRY